MTEDHSKYYFVDTIVDEWLDDNDLTNHWYTKALRWAIRGMEEIAIDVWQEPKTCLLDVTDRRTVILPPNCMDWTKVGAKVGQYCITLGTNEELSRLPRDPASSQAVSLLSQDMPNGIDVDAYEGYYFFNYNGGKIYSVGTGLPSKGFFKMVDHGTCKELLLDYDFNCSQVYVEFITNGFDPCGNTVVDARLKDYITKYIDMKYEEKNNPKATETSKFEKGRDVFYADRKVRARRNNLDPQTMINISRKGAKLTPKL